MKQKGITGVYSEAMSPRYVFAHAPGTSQNRTRARAVASAEQLLEQVNPHALLPCGAFNILVQLQRVEKSFDEDPNLELVQRFMDLQREV
jgi:hypothetical protein